MESVQDVIVIGGGIAGLTAAALLAHEGLTVTLLEAHHQLGGCAGTFRRGRFIFDVGATQVAGLEPGGSHARLFQHLGIQPPEAEQLDPGCVVDLNDGSPPVHLWHDPQRWRQERSQQFPDSERFWQLCSWIHQQNWQFAAADPVLPVRTGWDLGRTLAALSPGNLACAPLSLLTVSDLLSLSGCAGDPRLRRFLDLQLRLYSQQPSDRTAALYGATVLQMCQAPLGLWHLHGSMQSLSEQLATALERDGGRVLLRHRALKLDRDDGQPGWSVRVEAPAKVQQCLRASEIICSLPPQCLPELIPDQEQMPDQYRKHLNSLKAPSGALVFYGAVERHQLPDDCPGHLQRDGNSPGSLFLSISRDGDGRAPKGQATVIASVFTSPEGWQDMDEKAYQQRKRELQDSIRQDVNAALNLPDEAWLHQELATPRGFAHWTGRPNGVVGGLGQSPGRFGPFGLASRTPIPQLWLCGDSIHPGEGTAGVSLSALMACRQLMAARGLNIRLAA
ncbi:C-3'/4' desaturase [Synechococcus sp. BIOS-E4-1]|uniref:C-3',4' desaturase CrtD n=1 Tax=Synechococcus sp. BIOS-E4-1 TaxID=1400864 RepID=UPI00164741C3|nr:C-3',4' desaturase CrtD [Synechococcus sp. BIOS-E4-1]QNI53114.1 C-3'/4' desaturase [Synechococcus sp. BIOS-E4-1]